MLVSSSSSFSAAGMEMTLVITAEPDTATAAFLALVPDFLTARRMHSPTASWSLMVFSTTASTGMGSTAWLSTRKPLPVWVSSSSLTEVELMSNPTKGGFFLLNRNTFFQ